MAHGGARLLPPPRILGTTPLAPPGSSTAGRERIVVTGAAGFIGSHLSEALLDRGHAVVGIDNLLTGDRGNVEHLLQRDFRLIQQDVARYIDVDGPVDRVLHWASPASPADYLAYPIQTLKAGALGTHNALGLARAKGAAFVLASTSEVYGDPAQHPQPETYWGHVNPIGPRGVYDEAKRFAEAMTTAYHRHHGLRTRIARIFNTYGPRMRLDDGRAVPNFIVQALRGEDLTIYGDGEQTRSFCYISDLVEGVIRLMHADTAEPVNIGNPQRDVDRAGRPQDHRGGRIALARRPPAPAGRRSEGAQAGHHPRPQAARLGTPRIPGNGVARHDRRRPPPSRIASRFSQRMRACRLRPRDEAW